MTLPEGDVHFMLADLTAIRGRVHKLIQVRDFNAFTNLSSCSVSECLNSKQPGREKAVPIVFIL